MWKRFILFLVLNFGALALGGFLMSNPATNLWYKNLHQAPWTPPGWVFGAAWFTVMIFFSIYMASVLKSNVHRAKWITLFAIQFVLNVAWNPVFFRFHHIGFGLVVLLLLFIVLLLMVYQSKDARRKTLPFLLPYLIWMCVAISLNGYIFMYA